MAWFDEISPDLTYDAGAGSKAPLTEHPFIRESPDLGHFVQKSFNQHREIGSRIPVRKIETPEGRDAWKRENMGKLYDAGVFERPPADVAGYEIKKPEDL